MRAALLAAVFLLGAMPASAQAVSQRAAALLDVIIANGCAMSKDEAAARLPGLGYARPEYRALLNELKNAGMVMLSPRAATVAGGHCPLAPPPPMAPSVGARVLVPAQVQYIAVLRHNGCQLQTGEASSLFPKYGMDAGLASELEEGLVDSGVAIISEGALHIGPAYCIADERFPAAPDLTAEERHLVEVLETGSCTLLQSQIALSFPQDGMSAAEAQAAVSSLLASGGAMAVQGGDRIWLSPALCEPWSERKD